MMNSIARLSGIEVETANTTVAAPNTATDHSILGPTWVLSGKIENHSAVTTAPQAGAIASCASPVSQTSRISRA